MGNDDRALRQLDEFIARMQRRLGRDDDRGGWPGFVGGLALGTALGAALALFLAPRAGEEADEDPAAARDAIVLRERTDEARDGGAVPRPLAAPAPETGTPEPPDGLAAAELESPEALADIAENADAEEGDEPAPPEPAPVEDEVGDAAVAPVAAPAAPADGETGTATARGQREPVEGECPVSHPIKGNKGSMGALIYHLPGTANYERTNPETCFATEADAEAAGYRAPRR